MSTAAHTPGPWLREGKTIYTLMHHGWRKGVEQFKNRFYVHIQADKECLDEEHEANILLIVAAPELLTALQKMVERIEYYTSLADDVRPNIEQWEYTNGSSDMERARAAIAKATGAA